MKIQEIYEGGTKSRVKKTENQIHKNQHNMYERRTKSCVNFKWKI